MPRDRNQYEKKIGHGDPIIQPVGETTEVGRLE
jgi:hypothetical protein